MSLDGSEERQRAHAYLDMLAPDQLNAVRSLLEVMVEPLSHSLATVPVEDEDLNIETEEAISRAKASLGRGEGIPHEDILREFGLTK